MTTINYEIVVSGNAEDVWQALADFAGISAFHPLVKNSYTINSTAHTGLGAERRCELSDDGKRYIDEKIVRFVEGKEYDVAIAGGSQTPPVKNLLGTMGMESLSNNQHRIYLKVAYQPRFGLVGMVMDRIMLKPFISRAFNGVLQGFKLYLETGQTVQGFDTLRVAGLIA